MFCQLPLTSPKFLVLALAHTADFVREHGWRAGQTIAVDLEEIQYRGPAFIMLIRESAVPTEGEGELLMVVEHRDLDDRGVMLYGKGPVAAEVMRRRTEQTREIELVMHKPDGTRTDITLVRHVDWVTAHQAEAGGEIFLDLADMGARGFARVLEVRACPPLPVPEKYRPGARMVTGTFHHSSGDVYDLKLAAEARPLGVTGTHPFWSVDRQGWVGAAQLRLGERLKTLRGTTHVESLKKRPHPESVCNIEVEGEHVYRVGESGVLVHNASAGCVSNRAGFIDYGDFDDWGVETTTSDHYGGRPTGVHAFLVIGQPAGTDAEDYLIPPGWDDLPVGLLRARGHLLARQLGGSGSEPRNIVALHRQANSPAMRECENRIAEALRCECVEVWITPLYTSDSGAPSAVRIGAVGDRGFTLGVTITNSSTASTPSQC